ncbi:M20/M25/M40 family metallo-hydrolase [Henriciella litoralis]|uniref:M20/M25/M40 family metallo-hydrolase n=1 Tax=Henriciella litoralis TaxID=568102 RepID=UPI000A0584AC|nr:M20/M25/M40 family metallo-hydrolase [Henriciella litoralis]
MKRLCIVILFMAAACTAPQTDSTATTSIATEPALYAAQLHDAARAFATLETLASDEMAGRETGEPGNQRAIEYIENRLTEMKAEPAGETGYRTTFTSAAKYETTRTGTNILAIVPGTSEDAKTIIMSAHFDHLGEHDGEIYNGADDNASGVAALFEILASFQASPPENDVVFAFFDAEEKGFGGSKAFVEAGSDAPPAFNLNLDMVSRADKGEIYAVGTYHFPALKPVIESVAQEAPLTLLMGHDSPEWGDQDWSLQSDHAPFLEAGIPILYLGVEDHADYHQPTDESDKVDPAIFARSVDTAILLARAVDDWVAAQP